MSPSYKLRYATKGRRWARIFRRLLFLSCASIVALCLTSKLGSTAILVSASCFDASESGRVTVTLGVDGWDFVLRWHSSENVNASSGIRTFVSIPFFEVTLLKHSDNDDSPDFIEKHSMIMRNTVHKSISINFSLLIVMLGVTICSGLMALLRHSMKGVKA